MYSHRHSPVHVHGECPGAYAGRSSRGCPARGGAPGSPGASPRKNLAFWLLDFDGRYSLDKHVMPLLSIPYAKESF